MHVMTIEFEENPELQRLKEWMNALKTCVFRTFRGRTIQGSEIEILCLRARNYNFYHCAAADQTQHKPASINAQTKLRN
jgi:hypothetical protein